MVSSVLVAMVGTSTVGHFAVIRAPGAEVLRIPLEQLLTDSRHDPPTGSALPVDVLGVIDALYAGTDSTDPPTPTALQRRLSYCCEAFQACHYATLARELPPLIVDAGRAAHSAPVGMQSEAQAVLSRVHQLVTSYLHKYGEATAIQAALAADRALVAAERSGDPVQIGAAARRVAKSLVYQHRPQTAVQFATSTARRLEDELVERGPLGLSTLGMLYLSAALAASSTARRGTRRTHRNKAIRRHTPGRRRSPGYDARSVPE
jgi:hypothetical protein